MVKYIVFDFDGTLVDSKSVFISAFNQLAEQHGFNKILPENIEHLKALPIKERFGYLNFPFYKLPFLTNKFLKLYRQSLPEVLVVDGIGDLLPTLKALGYHLGIISTNSEPTIREFLQRKELNSIDAVYCSSKLFGKDRVIRKFMKAYGLKPSEIIYVGDEQRDIAASQKVGVKVIAVTWGYDSVQAIEDAQPNYIVSNPGEILAILENKKDLITP
jgi:phosphoglycolate phosphatase